MGHRRERHLAARRKDIPMVPQYNSRAACWILPVPLVSRLHYLLQPSWAETKKASSVSVGFTTQFLCLPLVSHLSTNLEHLPHSSMIPDIIITCNFIDSFLKRYVIDLFSYYKSQI